MESQIAKWLEDIKDFPLRDKRKTVLENTFKHYSENPKERRCTSTMGSCVYSPETAGKDTSEGCAIGRMLTSGLKQKLDELGEANVKGVFHLIPDEVKNLGVEFLTALQLLHDEDENWNETGSTPQGAQFYVHIRSIFIDSLKV